MAHAPLSMLESMGEFPFPFHLQDRAKNPRAFTPENCIVLLCGYMLGGRAVDVAACTWKAVENLRKNPQWVSESLGYGS